MDKSKKLPQVIGIAKRVGTAVAILTATEAAEKAGQQAASMASTATKTAFEEAVVNTAVRPSGILFFQPLTL